LFGDYRSGLALVRVFGTRGLALVVSRVPSLALVVWHSFISFLPGF